MQEEREARETREKEEDKAREEARERANETAEAAMEAAKEPDKAMVYESVRQLTIIAENQHADSNLALVAIAKAVLGLVGFVLKEDPIHHLHGRNIVPGKKTDVPVRLGPEPKGETESTTRERVQDDRKREYEQGVASMEDESRRDRERAEEADPSKPRRDDDDSEGTRPGDRPPVPGQDRPGEHPDHDLPNPPPNRPDEPGRPQPKRN